jgi:hypothetical protein
MMMNVSHFCFVLGSLTGLAGMSLGIYMGIAQDHSLTPIHAHLNLIGWVGMFLFGLYYRAHPEAAPSLAKYQAGTMAVGYLAMTAGLASLIAAPVALAFPLAVGGSILVWLSMAMFVAIAWRTARKADSLKTLQQAHLAMPN